MGSEGGADGGDGESWSLSGSSGLVGGGDVAYTRGARTSVGGGRLASYSWEGRGRGARARVLLVHGFRSHTRYNFLANAPGALHAFGAETPAAPPDSFVARLVRAGFDVHAHDHAGHGDSHGLRAYFDSFDVLVDDVLAHAHDLAAGRGSHHAPWPGDDGFAARRADRDASRQEGLPLFVVAHSMGGAICVLASMREPGVIAGMMLSSAATEAPRKYSGWLGPMWYFLALAACVLLPTTELLPMEKNTRQPDMQALFESDPLNLSTAVRGRVGYEFMCAYARIADSLHLIKTPFLTMSGRHDTLVDPDASERFFRGAASSDKELNVREDNWHNLLTEPGKEENWRLYIEWVDKRAPPPRQKHDDP